MDVSRRTVFGVAAGALAIALAGCGGDDRRLADACSEAARAVPGVRKADLAPWSGAEFESGLSGVIEVDASGESAVLGKFDEAMRAVVTKVHEMKGADGDYCRIGRVTGRGTDGSTVDVMALDPAWPAGATPSIGAVTASSLYERYGLA